MKETTLRRWPSYRTVWRWHFFAGLFCIPFVIFLSLTGTVYLFKPQVEAWQEQPYETVAPVDKHRPMSEQVQAVLSKYPTTKTIQVQLPRTDSGATRMILKDTHGSWRVYVHPATLAILHVDDESALLMKQIKSLHGQLGVGTWGSYLVELAACWTIVMILTGLVLWWPSNAKGFGGVLYPRWGKGKRVLWRDTHSVLGFWISAFAIFLILTGLPWAKFWGNYFRTLRQTAGLASVNQDWSIGGESIKPQGDHSEHDHPPRKTVSKRGGRSVGGPIPKELKGFDLLHAIAKREQLAYPVLLSPPESELAYWKVASEAQNRPLRKTLMVDVVKGQVASKEDFSEKHWIDKAVGIGIAAHEGQLFGALNQILGLMTTAGLIALAASGGWMWWSRRQKGTMGIPEPLQQAPLVWSVWIGVLVLGVAMPLFGASLAMVLFGDKLLNKQP